jgi:hypothetical protein
LNIEHCKLQIGSSLRLVGGFAALGCESTSLEAGFQPGFRRSSICNLQFAVFNLQHPRQKTYSHGAELTT